MSEVSGRTRVIGILADPIAHVRTPQALNALFAARAHDAIVVPLHVGSDDLAQVIAAVRRIRSFAGLIATIPHKTALARLCDELLPEARLVGAVNIVRITGEGRLIGQSFDGIGFVGGLRRHGVAPEGRSVLLVGAGGAASSIAAALANAGAARLTLCNRSAPRAEALARALRTAFPHIPIACGNNDPTGHDLIVNGTSLGMAERDELPVDIAALTPGMVVADVVMQPARTRLLEEAAARGCVIQEGLRMMTGQLDAVADFLIPA